MPPTILKQVSFGDTTLETEFPERTRILQPPEPLPPLENPEQAIRDALASPIDHEPLSKSVGPQSKVTIAFDDPCMPMIPMKSPDFREMAITILLEELDKLGVSKHNIRLICANALHRKWTRKELTTILGSKIIQSFGLSQLYCHDAEDPESLIYLGETERGFEVEVNRAVIESDLFIYVNVTNSAMNGGWKSIVVGLSSFRSIRHHHRPFPGASGKSVMDHKRSSFQKLLGEMGKLVDAELDKRGRRILTLESVVNTAQPSELIAVFAGHPAKTHEETLKILDKQQVISVQGQSDVVVYGLSNQMDHYSKLSTINPILVRNLGLSYSFGLYQNKPLVREGGILILAHPCPRVFHPLHQPSYEKLFEEVLPHLQDPYEVWDVYSEDYAHRPEFIHKYRYAYAYHGVHPLILWGQGAFALRHVSRVFLAGATDSEAAQRLGFEPITSIEEAIQEAENTLGKDCSITYQPMPPFYVPKVEVETV
jgi:nickel-dependent lactate racemase